MTMTARAPLTQTINRRRFLESVALAAGGLLVRPGLGLAFEDEAAASKELIVRTQTPVNGESALGNLAGSWITPLEYFYVRSNGTLPQIDDSQYRLSVEGLVDRPFTIGMAELKERFSQTTVAATMTCAGNRREEHSRVRPVDGVQWGAGAIGNARWGGVRLSDLLRHAGLKAEAKHVWFEGLDEIAKGGSTISFGASIPIEKTLQDSKSAPGALVTHEMNGQPLRREHGFPLRMVVPGYIGARSVKWLGRIIVSDRPSNNYYLTRAYKVVADDEEATWNNTPPIYEYPINAVICDPQADAKLRPGTWRIRGYALCAGVADRTIRRVEVSTDGGRTWTAASLGEDAQPFCWRLWQADIQIEPKTKELVVRSIDSAGNVQPQQVDWNFKGYLYNAWHRVPVQMD
jgi:sulfite oxidase